MTDARADTLVALAAERDRFVRRLSETCLPWWAAHGVDHLHGGFFERIDADGRPTDEPRRTRLVARQIYVFAQSRRFGWTDAAEADSIVDHGLDFLEHRCLTAAGTVHTTVPADGTPAAPSFDLYDHAFALFALAEVARIRPDDARVRRLGPRIRDVLVAGWRHPIAGFERARPRALPLEANPHMHLLEAFLAWSEVAPDDPAWAARVDDVAALALDRLIAPATGALGEYWDGDWRPMAVGGRLSVEPGHQFEWAWLLARRAATTGDDRPLAAARRLVEIGESRGVDPVRDLAIAVLDGDLAVVDPVMRLWPQTERLKAHLALADASVDAADAAAHAALALRATRGIARFLDHPRPGLWWDLMAADGRFSTEPTRASSLYHVVCAVIELDARLARAGSTAAPRP